MAQSNAVPGFKASVNGLHFTNSWPNEPDIVANVPPFGNVSIGDASNGLCGGMVFTVRDVFQAGLPPIPDTANPAPSLRYSTTLSRASSPASTFRAACSSTSTG